MLLTGPVKCGIDLKKTLTVAPFCEIAIVRIVILAILARQENYSHFYREVGRKGLKEIMEILTLMVAFQWLILKVIQSTMSCHALDPMYIPVEVMVSNSKSTSPSKAQPYVSWYQYYTTDNSLPGCLGIIVTCTVLLYFCCNKRQILLFFKEIVSL